jgi:hypothetical protein
MRHDSATGRSGYPKFHGLDILDPEDAFDIIRITDPALEPKCIFAQFVCCRSLGSRIRLQPRALAICQVSLDAIKRFKDHSNPKQHRFLEKRFKHLEGSRHAHYMSPSSDIPSRLSISTSTTSTL